MCRFGIPYIVVLGNGTDFKNILHGNNQIKISLDFFFIH